MRPATATGDGSTHLLASPRAQQVPPLSADGGDCVEARGEVRGGACAGRSFLAAAQCALRLWKRSPLHPAAGLLPLSAWRR